MANDPQKSQRRRELAEFLRSRRERLKPESLGLALAARRRTPGLRREEVAELAGVGATWYTWLEQARDIQPSEDVLARLAVALRLNAAETEHLFALSGRATPAQDNPTSGRAVPPSVRRAMEEFIDCPAVVLNRRWDVLAANARALEVFPGLSELPPDRKNWLFLIFCGGKVRERLVDWEPNARRLLAEFRLSASGYLDAPWIQDLVAELKASSLEFSAWWDEHDVRDLSSALIKLRASPQSEAVAYERVMMFPADGDGLRLVLYLPQPMA
jgi:transcriptional regulator with XRE-family HTH domain